MFQAQQLKQAEEAARRLGIELQLFEATAANEFEAAFTAMNCEAYRALVILIDPLYMNSCQNARGTVCERQVYRHDGIQPLCGRRGLISYAPDYADSYKRAAVYVAKILKGTKPADLPVEQATKFELVVNLKTAKDLGLDIPTSILLRANRVIE